MSPFNCNSIMLLFWVKSFSEYLSPGIKPTLLFASYRQLLPQLSFFFFSKTNDVEQTKSELLNQKGKKPYLLFFLWSPPKIWDVTYSIMILAPRKAILFLFSFIQNYGGHESTYLQMKTFMPWFSGWSINAMW